MNRTIPLDKRSKCDRRAYSNDQRDDWNGVVLATRIIFGKKGYEQGVRVTSRHG